MAQCFRNALGLLNDLPVEIEWPYGKLNETVMVSRRINSCQSPNGEASPVASNIMRGGWVAIGVASAAAEFLTNPAYFAEAVKNAPSGWSGKNMQVVLSAKVMSGTGGPPRVMAVHFW
jgi:hypothetical protein